MWNIHDVLIYKMLYGYVPTYTTSYGTIRLTHTVTKAK